MANKVTIDSSALESILSKINTDKTKIEDVKSKLDTAFSALTNAGLFETCLTSLKDEADSIISTYDALYNSIKTHLDDVTSTEDQVTQVANNYRSYYSASSGGGSGSSVSGSESTTTDIGESKEVDTTKIEDEIEKLDVNSVELLLNFINIVKDTGKTLIEILFDEDNAEYLANLLVSFYSLYGLTEVEYDDASEVQKKLLKLILNSNEDLPASLTDITILQFKTYLQSVAKDNNITAYDLVMEDEYKDLLTTSLQKLYDKDVDKNEFDENYCIEFQAFVNMKANKNNKTTEEVLKDIKNLL
jgi:hypothetical protein